MTQSRFNPDNFTDTVLEECNVSRESLPDIYSGCRQYLNASTKMKKMGINRNPNPYSTSEITDEILNNLQMTRDELIKSKIMHRLFYKLTAHGRGIRSKETQITCDVCGKLVRPYRISAHNETNFHKRALAQ